MLPLPLSLDICFTTQTILQQRSQSQCYYPSKNEKFRVSSHSMWSDSLWIFDNLTPGTKKKYCRIVWDVPMTDGTNLCDPEYAVLLEELRILVWSCFIDPRNSAALAPASLTPFGRGINMLAVWMVENNYMHLDELDQRASERYREAVQKRIANRLEIHDFPECDVDDMWCEQSGGVSSAWVMHLLMPWSKIWSQRSALKDAGLGAIKTGKPFGGTSINKISEDLATALHTAIPPLPDEVAIEILNVAQNYMDSSVYDLTEISEYVAALRYCKIAKTTPDKFVQDFDFNSRYRSLKKWHANPLRSSGRLVGVRRLIDDFIGAASATIQGESGMRVSELLSLKAGLRPKGLPECITVRPSRSGMLNLYYITGMTSKMRANPEETEWLIGATPRDSKILPVAVQAIVAVQELLDPWRKLADENTSDLLFIDWKCPGFPNSEDEIVPMTAQALSRRQQTFFFRMVNWENFGDDPAFRVYKATKGKCIVTHQWRKTYARFLFQVNPKMIPAIARQFKHLSLAMTEKAYVGTDISLLKDIANENLNMTADLLLKQLRGHGPKHIGRLAKIMDSYKPDMEKIIEDANGQSAYEAIRSWCANRNLKIFFHGYGSCLPGLAPTEAECHKKGQTVHWANKTPNYGHRRPGTCTGCYLFIAGPDTIDYWMKRYSDNITAWQKAKIAGVESQFTVAKNRAEQSLSYLRGWGVDVPLISLEDEVFN